MDYVFTLCQLCMRVRVRLKCIFVYVVRACVCLCVCECVCVCVRAEFLSSVPQAKRSSPERVEPSLLRLDTFGLLNQIGLRLIDDQAEAADFDVLASIGAVYLVTLLGPVLWNDYIEDVTQQIHFQDSIGLSGRGEGW